MEYTTHVVKKGEHLTGISKAYGFKGSDWRKIYRHPMNKDLRRKRKDPNVIWPGDKVLLPKVTLAEMKKKHKELTELLKNTAATQAPVQKAMSVVMKAQAEALQLQKTASMSEKEVKRLQKAQQAAWQDWKNAEKWQSLCKLGGKNDPSFAGSVICIPEGNRVFATMRKYLETQATHFAALQKSKGDAKKLELAIRNIRASHKIAETYVREWEKTHELMLNEISLDIKRAEQNMKETF
ncbi:MAG: LysM peptidoglycan-binding domain-containing protein [Rhodobacteraceae bacterium]|nr:LysM peptidoglycan-binding domain-containing protein [Paracoccaceae bacterium]